MAGKVKFLTAAAALAVCAGPLAAASPEAINAAIAKGAAYLKNSGLTGGAHAPGAQALEGLALLECGVPANDPIMVKLTGSIRDACYKEFRTYHVTLALLYLDRYGDAADVPLIQVLGARLLSGQHSTGGWGYTVPGLVDGQEAGGLAAALAKPPENSRVHPEADRVLKKGPEVAAANERSGEDNSNTQFAILGLWTARKHGIPVDGALHKTETRFRLTQHPDWGGWQYTVPNMASTPAMTCAGLLGLAFAYGTRQTSELRGGKAEDQDPSAAPSGKPKPAGPKRDPLGDPAVQKALNLLAFFITPRAANAPLDPAQQMIGGESPDILLTNFYFLWSLERVAVAFGVEKINGRDWYAWGSNGLVASQGGDGSWRGKYDPEVDTAFALLFLKKANLARDLKIKKQVELTSGKEKETKPDLPSVPNKGHETKPTKPDLPSLPNKGNENKPSKPEVPPIPKPEVRPEAPPKGPVNPPTPTIAHSEEGKKLADELMAAQPKQQDDIIARLKDGRGSAYTEALAIAVPKLADAQRDKARDALADRLTRMTAETLRNKLRDTDREIRRAAALACAMKDDKDHVPDLIESLTDGDGEVVKACRAALRSLTEKDFGPSAGATAADRAKAAADWRAWWVGQKKGK
jgi:hypothetical protein